MMRFWCARLGSFLSLVLLNVSACFVAVAQGTALLPEQEAALRGIARAETVDWTDLTGAQATALHERAERYLDLYQKYHLPHGLNADVWWNDYERSSVSRLEGLGDSAAWTGHYLAALALKHNVTQNAKTRSDILAVLDKFDLLTVVSGREGYIARYAGPADDAGYREYYSVYGKGEDPDRPGLGKRAFRGVEPYTDLVWLGYSSRDTYDGVNFGLAIALAYVRDDEVEGRVKRIVERVVDRLIEDSWDIPDGKGNTTRATPTYKAAWMRTALSVNGEKYGSLREEYAEICAWIAQRSSLKSPFEREYFANNLLFIRLSALCALEKDPELKKLLNGALTGMYLETRDHLNPHFAAIYLLATGDTENEEARALVQGLLIDFPGPPKFGRAVDLRKDTSIEMQDDEFTKYALLSRERVPSDFYWQRSPCLSHGSFDLPYEFPGIDVFLPYWMGRVAGVIPAPN
ncbi:MAG: hypothetical protein AMXMBFR82_27180 [Candidatus Hydrogenedentota bacterium]